jgi:hypothetical protein
VHSTTIDNHIRTEAATPISLKTPSSLTYSGAGNQFVEGSSSMCMDVEYPSQELVQESQDATEVMLQSLHSMLTLSSSLICPFFF